MFFSFVGFPKNNNQDSKAKKSSSSSDDDDEIDDNIKQIKNKDKQKNEIDHKKQNQSFIFIEMCKHCKFHEWHTHHDSHKYKRIRDKFKISMNNQEKKLSVMINKFSKDKRLENPRIGSFEVFFLYKDNKKDVNKEKQQLTLDNQSQYFNQKEQNQRYNNTNRSLSPINRLTLSPRIQINNQQIQANNQVDKKQENQFHLQQNIENDGEIIPEQKDDFVNDNNKQQYTQQSQQNDQEIKYQYNLTNELKELFADYQWVLFYSKLDVNSLPDPDLLVNRVKDLQNIIEEDGYASLPQYLLGDDQNLDIQDDRNSVGTGTYSQFTKTNFSRPTSGISNFLFSQSSRTFKGKLNTRPQSMVPQKYTISAFDNQINQQQPSVKDSQQQLQQTILKRPSTANKSKQNKQSLSRPQSSKIVPKIPLLNQQIQSPTYQQQETFKLNQYFSQTAASRFTEVTPSVNKKNQLIFDWFEQKWIKNGQDNYQLDSQRPVSSQSMMQIFKNKSQCSQMQPENQNLQQTLPCLPNNSQSTKNKKKQANIQPFDVKAYLTGKMNRLKKKDVKYKIIESVNYADCYAPIRNTTYNEIISINLGQAGIQAGALTWNNFCQEYNIFNATERKQIVQISDRQKMGYDLPLSSNPIEKEQQMNQESILRTFFIEEKNGQVHPLSLFFDLEENHRFSKYNICGQYKDFLFNPFKLYTSKYGADGIFTKGREDQSKSFFVEYTSEVIRKYVEECENFQGFNLTLAVGGGAGSGHGSLLVESIKDSYYNKHICLFPIFPAYNNMLYRENMFECYNTILSLKTFLNDTDVQIIFDNEHLSQMALQAQSNLDKETMKNSEDNGKYQSQNRKSQLIESNEGYTKYNYINQYISKVFSNLVSSRYISQGQPKMSNLIGWTKELKRKINICYPVIESGYTVDQKKLLQNCFEQNKTYSEYNKCLFIYKGNVDNKQKLKVNDIKKTILENKYKVSNLDKLSTYNCSKPINFTLERQDKFDQEQQLLMLSIQYSRFRNQINNILQVFNKNYESKKWIHYYGDEQKVKDLFDNAKDYAIMLLRDIDNQNTKFY